MTVHNWPLPADDSAAGVARAHVSQVLEGLPGIDDAVQVTSELAANAVHHGAPPIDLELAVTSHGVRVCVSNAGGTTAPAPRTATLDDVRGRGLAIVAALSDDWGWHHRDGRLHVWAELRHTDRSRGAMAE